MCELKSGLRINTSCSSFRDLRENGFCYVDKTGFLEEFLGSGPLTASYVTRPGGFGRSMTLSMCAEFFDIEKDSRALFDGLRIAQDRELCKKWMNAWPVLSFTMKDIVGPSLASALGRFSELAAKLCAGHLYLLESPKVGVREKRRIEAMHGGTVSIDEAGTVLQVLLRAMAQHYGKEVILLCDGYDVPAAKAQENGFLEDMLAFMRNVYGPVLKENRFLKFALLAGSLGLPKESSYTGLNNIECYDINASSYADKIGFTDADVDSLLSAAGLMHAKEAIRSWYGGWCFGKTEIFCPRDVLHYVRDLQENPGARPLPWIGSGDNGMARRCIGKNAKWMRKRLCKLLDGGSVSIALPAVALTYDSIDCPDDCSAGCPDDIVWMLLWQMGYLAKDLESYSSKDERSIALRIPNRKVAALFSQYIGQLEEKERAGK